MSKEQPSTNLVERLRDDFKHTDIDIFEEAADTIERLEERTAAYKGQVEAGAARIAELEKALRDLLRHEALAAMEGCSCETCAPVARASALIPRLARTPGKPL